MAKKRTRYMLNDVETAKLYLQKALTEEQPSQIISEGEDSSENVIEGEVVTDLKQYAPQVKQIILMAGKGKLEYSPEQLKLMDGQIADMLGEASHNGTIIKIINFFNKAPFLKELLSFGLGSLTMYLLQKNPDLAKILGSMNKNGN